MVTISPVYIAAITANQLSVLATFKEKLCRWFKTSVIPTNVVSYSLGTPVINGTTLFIPVTATISVTYTPGNSCRAVTNTFVETFEVAFQGQTALPTAVTINSVGKTSNAVNMCGGPTIHVYDSLTIDITPTAAASTSVN